MKDFICIFRYEHADGKVTSEQMQLWMHIKSPLLQRIGNTVEVRQTDFKTNRIWAI